MTLLSRARVSPKTMYVVPFMRYSASKNGVTQKLGQGSFKVIGNGTVRQIIYDFIHRPLLVQLYVVPFSSYLTLNNRDLEKVTEGHPNRQAPIPFESLVQFPNRFPQYLTMAVSLTVYEVFSVKEQRDLENWVRGLFKITENGAVRQTTYDSLLVRHCKSSCMLYHFQVI